MMSAACQGFIADKAAETDAAVICSVSARASAGDIAASHLPASPGRSLRNLEIDTYGHPRPAGV